MFKIMRFVCTPRWLTLRWLPSCYTKMVGVTVRVIIIFCSSGNTCLLVGYLCLRLKVYENHEDRGLLLWATYNTRSELILSIAYICAFCRAVLSQLAYVSFFSSKGEVAAEVAVQTWRVALPGPSPAGGCSGARPPIWNLCPSHFTFGPLVAPYIQYSILKMRPPILVFAPSPAAKSWRRAWAVREVLNAIFAKTNLTFWCSSKLGNWVPWGNLLIKQA